MPLMLTGQAYDRIITKTSGDPESFFAPPEVAPNASGFKEISLRALLSDLVPAY